MMKLRRSIILLSMLALFSGSLLLHAQESTEEAEATETVQSSGVTIAGSGIVNPVVEQLVEAEGTGIETLVTTNGTAAGFAALCDGSADLATASRVINLEESLACSENGVEYYELVIGFDVTAFVANQNDAFLTCLTIDQINTIFAPSASSQITNWSQIGLESAPDLNLTTIITPDTSLTYAAVEAIAGGIGLRSDAAVQEPADAVAAVASTSGSIAAIPYQAAVNALSTLQLVALDFGNGEGCVQPSVEAVEDESYLPATPLLLYVNRAKAEQLESLLQFVTSDASADVIANTGFTPSSAALYEVNRAILRGEQENRVASEDLNYTIAPDLTGTVAVGGSTAGFRIADSTANRITSTVQGLVIDRQFNGQLQDTTQFCGGNLDVLFSTRSLTEEEQAACNENGVTALSLPVGSQAVVLVGNAADDFATCLTVQQISTIWGIAATGTVMNWNNVAETFPDQALTLFSLREGNSLNDLLLSLADVPLPALRTDVTEQNVDPLYRAAATANVVGALTYMSWSDYGRVTANNQQNIQLIGVDAGSGCIVPGTDTISSGAYPLAQQVSMLVKESSLATKPVQAFVWSIFAEENENLFELSGLSAASPTELNAVRSDLLVSFASAEQSATEAAAEATEEPAEATPEATSESN